MTAGHCPTCTCLSGSTLAAMKVAVRPRTIIVAFDAPDALREVDRARSLARRYVVAYTNRNGGHQAIRGLRLTPNDEVRRTRRSDAGEFASVVEGELAIAAVAGRPRST